jgi:hypothetical protein
VGWREFVEMICPTGEAKYFCKRDSTGKSERRPTGKSVGDTITGRSDETSVHEAERPLARVPDAAQRSPGDANGSRECAPDDRLRIVQYAAPQSRDPLSN